MKKVISIVCLILLIILTSACFNKKIEKFYLTDKYYNEGKYIEVDSDELNNLEDDAYVVFTYNNFCNLQIPCEQIFEEFMKNYHIDFLSIPFEKYKSTYLYDKVKYAPTVIIVKERQVVAYLDANKDADLELYQDSKKFEEWFLKYVNLK